MLQGTYSRCASAEMTQLARCISSFRGCLPVLRCAAAKTAGGERRPFCNSWHLAALSCSTAKAASMARAASRARAAPLCVHAV